MTKAKSQLRVGGIFPILVTTIVAIIECNMFFSDKGNIEYLIMAIIFSALTLVQLYIVYAEKKNSEFDLFKND